MTRAGIAAQHPQQRVNRRRSKTVRTSAVPLLAAFKVVYTSLRRQHRLLEAHLDDAAVPVEQRRSRLGEFQRLAGCLNLLIEEIRKLGCRMDSEQILEGFNGKGK